MTIHWTRAGRCARGARAHAPDVLPSRPVAPSPPPTTYDVYEVPRAPAPANATPVMPTPLTPAPVGALEFVQEDVTLGTERCFVVRPVDILAGIHVRGPASPVVCASFADTFAPAPPGDLVAVAASGSISLIWNPSAAPDLAGYLVLRGEGPGATLSPLMPAPVAATTYTDTNGPPRCAATSTPSSPSTRRATAARSRTGWRRRGDNEFQFPVPSVSGSKGARFGGDQETTLN